MLRMPLTTRAKGRAGIGSTLAMALALAGGAAVGTVALTSPALAQRQQRQQQQQQTLSRNFQPVYQLVADATNTTGDLAAARAQVPALIAAIGSEYDRFFAGNILLQLGLKSSDTALQSQGLQLMLASGQGSATDNALFHYLLGEVAFNARDYAKARTEAEASIAGGFAGNFAERQDPWGLILDAYLAESQFDPAEDFLKRTIAQRRAAGLEVREIWLLKPLARAYELQLAEPAAEWAALLVETNPNQQNWVRSLQVVAALASDNQARLDALRLMALTDSLSQRGEFENYVAVLDPRVLASEAGRVLASGVAKGVLSTSDPFYAENKRVIDTRAGQEAGLAADYAAEAASASSGRTAFNAGDVYLSLGEYAKAEAMFALALQKGGGIDRDQVLTRLGIAQVHQGKNAEAKATFGQVSGQRAGLARLWGAYADSRA
jgi:hypothetical protein